MGELPSDFLFLLMFGAIVTVVLIAREGWVPAGLAVLGYLVLAALLGRALL